MDNNRKEELEMVTQQLKDLSATYRDAVGHIGISENE